MITKFVQREALLQLFNDVTNINQYYLIIIYNIYNFVNFLFNFRCIFIHVGKAFDSVNDYF